MLFFPVSSRQDMQFAPRLLKPGKSLSPSKSCRSFFALDVEQRDQIIRLQKTT
jgi:hypothetical protein